MLTLRGSSRFAVAFAGIVLYDYLMSNENNELELEQIEDEGHPPFDMYALASAHPRVYQQWLDAQ